MDKLLNNGPLKFFSGKQIPVEMHKVKIVQYLNLVPAGRWLEAINELYL